MREPKEHVNVRLRVCEMILDRGVGRPNQAVALDVALTRPLETMSTEELQELRTRYAAVVSASPPLIERVLAARRKPRGRPSWCSTGATMRNDFGLNGNLELL